MTSNLLPMRALAIALALIPLGVWAQVTALLLTTIGSLVAVRPFASQEGDPGWVVIDEAAGTLLATLGLGIPAALVAWAVFVPFRLRRARQALPEPRPDLPPGPAAYRIVVTFGPELHAAPGSRAEQVRDLTQQCADFLGAAVRERTEDWHMMQRVFVPAGEVVR